ncbi:MAG: ABC transporter substrate-binding protein [Lachnospiraceae bacterium]|nr:ABC transporter substrate-binding protein [Lachnospiraceae bacterium]
MRKLRKVIGITSIAALLLVSFGGCSSSATSTTVTGNDTTELTIIDEEDTEPEAKELPEVSLGTVAWPTNMFWYLAEEEGIFETNGVKVDIQEFSSTTESANAFVGGKTDFVTFASSETISPFSRGADFSIVLETDKSNGCEGLVATPDIKSIEDLAGKTVATQLYSVDHMFLLTLLEEHGMSESDIKIVDMSIQESGTAFIAGQCDAACIWDPYFSQAVDAGGTIIFSSADDPDLITDVLGASNSLIAEDPDTVKAVVKSYFDAVEYWKANPEESNAFMGEKMGVDAEEFAAEMEGLFVPTPADVVTAFTPAEDYTYWGYTQNTVRDFMYGLGILDSNEADCGDMIDATFVKALAE